MKRKLLASVLTIIACTSVHAESIQQAGVYLYPHASYYIYDDWFNLNPEDDYGLGLGIGYQFESNWAVEFSYDQINTETAAKADTETQLLELNSVYRFTSDSNWQPIVLAGIGHIQHEVSTAPSATPDGTTANLGGGIEYILSDLISLRADVRGIYEIDDSQLDYMATVGFNLMFGGNKKSADMDHDGVSDAQDNCPNTPMGTPVDDTGCALDTDKDGVVDYKDQCPDTPAGVKVDAKGCALDSDGDGVADHLDQCPDTPKGATVDDKGCRKMLTEDVSIKLNINFDSSKADIKPEFFDQVEKVAKFMVEYPDTRVVIKGYTDSSGSASRNLRLSERRAQAIANSLVKDHNISADRVSAVGYGIKSPVADNSTAAGRKLNRRVVAEINTQITKPE
ncbi:MAG: OmpA family protein [Pseudomonadales bacterium]|nr:OmpA family protein [Pseudomonadales bacterium]